MNTPHLTNTALHAFGVLVTRPKHQAASLISAIQKAGGQPYAYPTLEIQATSPPHALIKAAQQLDQTHLIIFVSANAVDYGLPILQQYHRTWPKQLKWAAVGASTGMRLALHADVEVIYPKPPASGSEALLALDAFNQIKHQQILIIRGDPGRPLLINTLVQRGAEVTSVSAYHTALPATPMPPAIRLAWQNKHIHSIVVTSNTGLNNLVTLFSPEKKQQLLHTPLITVSARIATHAKQLGFIKCINAQGASDAEIMQALVRWAHTFKDQHDRF